MPRMQAICNDDEKSGATCREAETKKGEEMKDLAKIIVHQHEIYPTGRKYRTFEWIGERYWPILVDCRVDLQDLPFKLHLIEERYDIGGGLYIRRDAFFPFGWMVVVTYKLRDVYWHFFNRFMATLNIWGLANTPHGAVPSWSDIGKGK